VLEQAADGQPAVCVAGPRKLGGALSGRDTEALSKPVSGLLGGLAFGVEQANGGGAVTSTEALLFARYVIVDVVTSTFVRR
jgi:hypothetical protein